MFSSRVPPELTPNRLAAVVAAHRSAGRPVLDLTSTNPTRVGFEYPADLLAPLANAAALVYQPEPFGLPAARAAVVGEFARRGISVAEDHVVVTSSTSEAYTLLFKLLCDPGDVVLVPTPSYPLFDHLTRLDAVRAGQYALQYHGRWEVDVDSMDAAWSGSTKAVLAVSPNNPTGSVWREPEWEAVTARCASRGAALIVDEVFADYPLEGGALPAGPPSSDALVFKLGGLSKSAALPQVKLGWIAIDGPPTLVRSALERLELICDTYLSVSTPVQVAVPALIERGADVRRQVQERIQHNYDSLRQASAADPSVQLLHADGGWSAVLRVPARISEEDLVIGLLEQRDTLLHPGFFFDFAHEAFLVFSLLPRPEDFTEGVRRVMEHLDD